MRPSTSESNDEPLDGELENAGGESEQADLPSIDFSTFVLSLSLGIGELGRRAKPR